MSGDTPTFGGAQQCAHAKAEEVSPRDMITAALRRLEEARDALLTANRVQADAIRTQREVITGLTAAIVDAEMKRVKPILIQPYAPDGRALANALANALHEIAVITERLKNQADTIRDLLTAGRAKENDLAVAKDEAKNLRAMNQRQFELITAHEKSLRDIARDRDAARSERDVAAGKLADLTEGWADHSWGNVQLRVKAPHAVRSIPVWKLQHGFPRWVLDHVEIYPA